MQRCGVQRGHAVAAREVHIREALLQKDFSGLPTARGGRTHVRVCACVLRIGLASGLPVTLQRGIVQRREVSVPCVHRQNVRVRGSPDQRLRHHGVKHVRRSGGRSMP